MDDFEVGRRGGFESEREARAYVDLLARWGWMRVREEERERMDGVCGRERGFR